MSMLSICEGACCDTNGDEGQTHEKDLVCHCIVDCGKTVSFGTLSQCGNRSIRCDCTYLRIFEMINYPCYGRPTVGLLSNARDRLNGIYIYIQSTVMNLAMHTLERTALYVVHAKKCKQNSSIFYLCRLIRSFQSLYGGSYYLLQGEVITSTIRLSAFLCTSSVRTAPIRYKIY